MNVCALPQDVGNMLNLGFDIRDLRALHRANAASDIEDAVGHADVGTHGVDSSFT